MYEPKTLKSNLESSFLDSIDSIDIVFFLGTELAELLSGLDRKITLR